MSVSTIEFESRTGIESIDWNNTRPVYKKLHTDFHRLTKPFAVPITPAIKSDLADLICAIDAVDRTIDPIKNDSRRVALCHNVVDVLTCDVQQENWIRIPNDELTTRLIALKRVLVKRNIKPMFCEIVREIFQCAEKKRRATTSKELMRHTRMEWRLTGKLTTLVIGPTCSKEFASFFLDCCEVMSVIDSLKDAREDFETETTKVAPGLNLYFRLIGQLMGGLPRLLWRFPNPILLVRYLASFLVHVFFNRGNRTA